MSQKLIYAYWSIRGRGQQIRFLLEYVEANYEEKLYHLENPEEWLQKDKKTLKPFPNLPYIIDGDFYLSEHDTLIKYIVKKHPKYQELIGIGKGPNDEFVIDQLVSVINDLKSTIRSFHFNPKIQEIKRDLLPTTQTKFNQLIEFKGQNKFLLPYLTIADFKLVEVLLYYKCIDEELFKTHLSVFEPYIQTFYSLPRISEYVKTEKYRQYSEFFNIKKEKAYITGKEFLEKFNKQFV